MNTAGLQTEQAPPLAIPVAFFLTAPVAFVAAGVLIAWHGHAGLASIWLPSSMALTHVGTLGVLGAVMFGALYQLVPVVAGAPVPWIRLAHGVHVALVVGVIGLVYALATWNRFAFAFAWTAILIAAVGFLGPVAVAMARAPARTETVTGIRIALVALTAVIGLGLWFAWNHHLGFVLANRVALIVGHSSLGALGWVGCLLLSVSLTVVPMFYLTPAYPRRIAQLCLGLVVASIAAIAACLALGVTPAGVAAAALPAAVAVWLVHPLVTLRLLGQRRRKRADPSLHFWRLAMAVAPLLLVLAVATAWLDDPRPPLLLGWLGLWGWAALLVHGMLTRILPFLVWFHRFSALVGLQPVPSMRQLLPERRIRIALGLHVGAVVAGAVGLGFSADLLIRIAGIGLAATGAALAWELVGTLARPRPATARSAETSAV